MSLWVRRCLTFACLLVAWLVARPAEAAAPLCDDRGASALAPSPSLDIPNASLNVGDHSDCDSEGARDKTYQRGQNPHRCACAAHVDGALPTTMPRVPVVSRELTVAPEVCGVERAGVRGSLERPPRARS